MKLFKFLKRYNPVTLKKASILFFAYLIITACVHGLLVIRGKEIAVVAIANTAFHPPLFLVSYTLLAIADTAYRDARYGRKRPGFWKAKTLQAVEDQTNNTNESDQIHGWRFANLVMDRTGGICFGSIVGFRKFVAEDDAKCWDDHDAPDPECGCGFSSVKRPLHLIHNLKAYRVNRVLLECRYFGTVIPATFGARAEKQQVLRVWLNPECAFSGCANHASHILIPDLPKILSEAPFYLDLGLHENTPIPVASLCLDHSILLGELGALFTSQQLREQLHTEVEWAPLE